MVMATHQLGTVHFYVLLGELDDAAVVHPF
jgi:hypothetical protein